MSSTSSWLGMTPASVSALPLPMIMNFTVVLLESRSRLSVGRAVPGSTPHGILPENSGGVLGVAVTHDLPLGTDPLLDLPAAGVALDRGDRPVVVVLDHEADVLDGSDAVAAVPGEEDDGARPGLGAPAVVVPEPLGVRHRVGVRADLGAGAELLADPGDEHRAPGGVQVGVGVAAVAGDGLQGALGAGIPVLELGAAALGVLRDADLRPGQGEHVGGGGGDLLLGVLRRGLDPVTAGVGVGREGDAQGAGGEGGGEGGAEPAGFGGRGKTVPDHRGEILLASMPLTGLADGFGRGSCPTAR